MWAQIISFGQPGLQRNKDTCFVDMGVERKNILWMDPRATTNCWYLFFSKNKTKKKVGSLLFSSMHVVDICTEKQNNKSHKTFREYDKILNETVLKNISRKLVSMSLSLSKCSNNPIEIGQNMANCWNGWTLFFPLTSSCGGEFLCVHSKFGAFYLHRATFYRAQNPRD